MRWLGVALLFAGAAAGPALAPAGEPGAAGDRVVDLLYTRDTHVDLDGDGTPELEREFDASGALVRQVYWNRAVRPNVKETFVVRRNPSASEWVWEIDAGPIRKVTEEITDNGILLRRTSLFSTHRDGKLDVKEVQDVGLREVTITTFHLASSGWVVQATRREKATLFSAGTRAAALLNCYNWAASGLRLDLASCATYVSGMPAAAGTIPPPDLLTLSPGACNGGFEYFTRSQFSIDTITCGSTGAIAHPESDPNMVAMIAATDLVGGPMLSCLATLNPALGRRFATELINRKPAISCLGTPSQRDTAAIMHCEDVAAGLRPQCRSMLRAYDPGSTAGVTLSGFSERLFVVGSDPRNPRHYRGIGADDETRMRAGVIFHEFLHLMGVPCGDMGTHNSTRFPHVDAVWGCQTACGFDPSSGPSDLENAVNASKESCLACTSAEGNTAVSEEARAICDALPPAEKLREIQAGMDGITNLSTCTDSARVRGSAAAQTRCRAVYEGAASACTPLWASVGGREVRGLVRGECKIPLTVHFAGQMRQKITALREENDAFDDRMAIFLRGCARESREVLSLAHAVEAVEAIPSDDPDADGREILRLKSEAATRSTPYCTVFPAVINAPAE